MLCYKVKAILALLWHGTLPTYFHIIMTSVYLALDLANAGIHFCRVGIALDTYMMPVEDGIEDKVEQPLLFINSWNWQWPENIIKMRQLVDVNSNPDGKEVDNS